MNRSQLALTIKSRIPREITAERAVGAGAGAREIGMEQKTRTDSSSKGRESERRVVGRQQYIGWQTSFRALASQLGGEVDDDQVGGNPGPDRQKVSSNGGREEKW